MGYSSRKRKGSDDIEETISAKKSKAGAPERLEDDDGAPYWQVRISAFHSLMTLS